MDFIFDKIKSEGIDLFRMDLNEFKLINVGINKTINVIREEQGNTKVFMVDQNDTAKRNYKDLSRLINNFGTSQAPSKDKNANLLAQI